MICKYVPSKIGGGKAARIGGLGSYIANPENTNRDEKCILLGSRNLISTEPQHQQAEMLAIAQGNSRSADPIEHFVLSWQSGEYPSNQQAQEAVDMWAQGMGVDHLQMIWGMHRDTDNVHVHMMINRVQVEDNRVHRINNGKLFYDRMAKVTAQIEHAQGWSQIPNARFAVVDEGVVLSTRLEPKGKFVSAAPELVQIISQAQSWPELHQGLAAVGWRYGVKGSGAVLCSDDCSRQIKASAVARDASLPKLQKRLGAYQHQRVQPTQEILNGIITHSVQPQAGLGFDNSGRGPGPKRLSNLRARNLAADAGPAQGLLSPDSRDNRRGNRAVRRQSAAGRNRGIGLAIDRPRTGVERRDGDGQRIVHVRRDQRIVVSAERWAQYEADAVPVRERRARLIAELRSGQQQQLSGLLAKQAQELDKLTAKTVGHADAKRQIANLRWMHRLNRGLMESRHREDMADLRQELAQPPRYHDWARQQEQRQGADYILCSPGRQPAAMDVGYDIVETDAGIIHERAGQPVLLDRGERIEVFESAEPIAVDRAWALGGADALSDHGKQLQQTTDQVAFATDSRRRERVMQQPQYEDFTQIQSALGAETYRVTLGDSVGGGGTTLSRVEGRTHEYQPIEVEARLEALGNFNNAGRHIYFTPLSDTHNYVVIDDVRLESADLTPDELGRGKRSFRQMWEDGVRPALLLETSPGSFQAIVKYPALEDARLNHEAGKRVSAELNARYGDPSIKSRVQPFRAPGYRNLKPKYRGQDGQYPTAKLHHAEDCVCERSQRRAAAIAADLRVAHHSRPQQSQNPSQTQRIGDGHQRPPAQIIHDSKGRSLYDVYRRHHQHVSSAGGGNLAEIDFKIATRMTLTGHSREAIQSAVYQFSPSFQSGEGGGYTRNQSEPERQRYAWDVAQSPGTPRGQETLRRVANLRSYWLALERGELAWQQEQQQTELSPAQRAQSARPDRQPEQERQRRNGPTMGR